MSARVRSLALALAGGLALAVSGCDRSTIALSASAQAPASSSPSPIVAASRSDALAVPPPHAPAVKGRGPGFPVGQPWVSFYGNAAQMARGDLARVAGRYRIINIDADPGAGNFTDGQLKVLKAGGRNRILSYMNVGACEMYRDYWSKAPAGFVGCGANRAAHLGTYEGYSDETWMDPSNADYQRLIVDHVARRLVARGVDGLYLDNLELLGHGEHTKNGPCNARCRQGGLDLVRLLREKFPDVLLVMQNGTSDVTRLGVTGGAPFPSLLDGIAHEEVYAPKYDGEAEAELLAWKAMSLESRDGHPLWIAVEDYVGSCKNTTAARAAMDRAAGNGFSSYVSDESGGQKVVCNW